MFDPIIDWLNLNSGTATPLEIIGVLLLSVLSYIVAYRVVGRALVNLAQRTDTTVDDIVLRDIRPRRLSLYAPILILLIFVNIIPDDFQNIVRQAILFILLWLTVLTFNSVLDVINNVY